MKNTSKVVAVVVTAVLFAFVVTSCDNGGGGTPPPAKPEERGSHGNNTPIPFSHGVVIIKGENLYPSEWSGTVNKVIAALNADAVWAEYFGAVIDTFGPDFTIIVKNTNEFLNYKTTRSGNIIYINSAILNTNALITAIQNAFGAIDGDMNIDIIGKIIPSRDNGWQRYAG